MYEPPAVSVASKQPWWSFSLRELILLMTAIAAFLGYAMTKYERSKRFTPTKLAQNFGSLDSVRVCIGEQWTWPSQRD